MRRLLAELISPSCVSLFYYLFHFAQTTVLCATDFLLIPLGAHRGQGCTPLLVSIMMPSAQEELSKYGPNEG